MNTTEIILRLKRFGIAAERKSVIRPVDVELAMGSPDIQSSFNAQSHSRMGFI